MSGDLIAMPDRRGPQRVVVSFPLPDDAHEHLAESLGDRVELIDVRDADGDEDVVLIPSTSRQLIGKISTAFPQAAVVVVEVEDASYGVELGGHVTRSLDAGADGYYVARSIDQLAAVVVRSLVPPEAAEQRRPVELAAPGEDELGSILDRLIQRETVAERAGPQTKGTEA